MKSSFHKIIFLFFVCGIITKASAQETSYKVLYDDPTDYKNLFINFHIANIDFATPMALRSGLGLEFALNKALHFNAEYDRSILKAMEDDDARNNTREMLELGATFNFFSKQRQGTVKFKWKELGTEYTLRVPGQALKQIGIRGGITAFASPKQLGRYGVHFNTKGLYAGISVITTKNMLVNANGIDMKHTDKVSRSNFYIDALFSPVISYADNAIDNAESQPFEARRTQYIDSAANKKMLGFRAGYMKTNKSLVPFKMGGEIGLRPGLQQNFYFLAKFAVAIGVNVGKSKKAE